MAVKIKLIYFFACIVISLDGFGQNSAPLADDLYDIVPLSNPKRASKYRPMKGSVDLTAEVWKDIFRSHIDSKSSSGWQTISVFWEFNEDGTFRETASQGLGGYEGGEVLLSGKYRFEQDHSLLFLRIEKSGIKSSCKKKGSTYFLPTEWVEFETPVEKVIRVVRLKPSRKHDVILKFEACEGADWSTSVKDIKKCKTFTQGIMGKNSE